MSTHLRTKLTSVLVLMALSAHAVSQANADFIVTLPGSPHTIDFSGFDGSGFAPTPAAGQLDSDEWSVTGMSDGDLGFGGTGTSTDLTRGNSTGGVTTGGIYSFDTSNGGTANPALGVQPGGSDFTPGSLTLRLMNSIGDALTSLDLSYDVSVYNDQGRANSFNFSYATEEGGTYVNLPSLDLTSPEAADGSPAWVTSNKSTTITGLSIPDGGKFFFRWTGDDVSGSGSRDEFALDNISVTPFSTPIPEPTSLAMVGLAGILLGRRRRRLR